MKKIEKSNSKITKKQKLFYLRNKLKSKKLIPTLSAMALAPLPLLAISANSNSVLKKIVRWSHGIPVVISINDYIKTSDSNNSSDDKYLYKYLSPNKNFHFHTTLYNGIKPKKGVQKFKINFQQVNTSLLKTRDISHDVSSLRNIIDKNDFNINEDIILKVGPNDMNVTNKTIKTYSLQTTSGLKYTADINLSKNSESNWEIKLDVYFNDESRNFLKENDALLKVTVNKALDNEIFADLQTKSSNIIENMEYPTKDSEMHDASLFPKIKSPNTIKEYIGQNGSLDLWHTLYPLKDTTFPDKLNQVIFSLNDNGTNDPIDDNDSDVSWLNNGQVHNGKFFKFINVVDKTKVNNIIIHGGVTKVPFMEEAYDKKFKINFQEITPKITKNDNGGQSEWADGIFNYATNTNKLSVNDHFVATLDSNTRYNQVIKKYDLKDSMGKKYSITLKWIRYDYKWWIAADFDFYDRYPKLSEDDAMLALTISTMNRSESKDIEVEEGQLVKFKKESISKINGVLYPPKDDKKHDADLFPKIKVAKDKAIKIINSLTKMLNADKIQKAQLQSIYDTIKAYRSSEGEDAIFHKKMLTQRVLAISAIKKLDYPNKDDKKHDAALFHKIKAAKDNAIILFQSTTDENIIKMGGIDKIKTSQINLVNKAIKAYKKSTGTNKILAENKVKTTSEINRIKPPTKNDKKHDAALFPKIKAAKDKGIKIINAVKEFEKFDSVKASQIKLINTVIEKYNKSTGTDKILADNKVEAIKTINAIIPPKNDKLYAANLFLAIAKAKADALKAIKGVSDYQKFDSVKSAQINLVNKAIKAYKKSTGTNKILANNKVKTTSEINRIKPPTKNDREHDAALFPKIKPAKDNALKLINAVKEFEKFDSVKKAQIKLINDAINAYNKSTGTDYKKLHSFKHGDLHLPANQKNKLPSEITIPKGGITKDGVKYKFIRWLPNDLLGTIKTFVHLQIGKLERKPSASTWGFKLKNRAGVTQIFSISDDKLLGTTADENLYKYYSQNQKKGSSVSKTIYYDIIPKPWTQKFKINFKEVKPSLASKNGSLNAEKLKSILAKNEFTTNDNLVAILDSNTENNQVIKKYNLKDSVGKKYSIELVWVKKDGKWYIQNKFTAIDGNTTGENDAVLAIIVNPVSEAELLAELKKDANNVIFIIGAKEDYGKNDRKHDAALFPKIKAAKDNALKLINDVKEIKEFDSVKKAQIKLFKDAIDAYYNSTGTDRIKIDSFSYLDFDYAISNKKLPSEMPQPDDGISKKGVKYKITGWTPNDLLGTITAHATLQIGNLELNAILDLEGFKVKNPAGVTQIFSINDDENLKTKADENIYHYYNQKYGKKGSSVSKTIYYDIIPKPWTQKFKINFKEVKASLAKFIWYISPRGGHTVKFLKSTLAKNEFTTNDNLVAILDSNTKNNQVIKKYNLKDSVGKKYSIELVWVKKDGKWYIQNKFTIIDGNTKGDNDAILTIMVNPVSETELLAELKTTTSTEINAIKFTKNDKIHDAALFPKITAAKDNALKLINDVKEIKEFDSVKKAQIKLLKDAINAYNNSTGTDVLFSKSIKTANNAINAIELPIQNDKLHDFNLFPAIAKAKSNALEAINDAANHQEVDEIKKNHIALIKNAINAYNKSTGTNKILDNNKVTAIADINAITSPDQNDKLHAASLFPAIAKAKADALKAIEDVTDHWYVDVVKNSQIDLITSAIAAYDDSTGTNKILANNKIIALAAINAIDLPTRDDKLHAATLSLAIDKAKLDALKAIEDITDYTKVKGVKSAQIKLINDAIDAYDKSTGTNQILANNKESANKEIDEITSPIQNDKLHAASLFPAIAKAKADALKAIKGISDYQKFDSVKSAHIALINDAINAYNKSTGTNQILAENKVTAIAAINAIDLPTQNDKLHAAILFPAIAKAKSDALKAIKGVSDYQKFDSVKSAQINLIYNVIDGYNDSSGTNQILADNKESANKEIDEITSPIQNDKLHAANLFPAIAKAKADAFKAIEDVTDYTKVKGVKLDQIKLINDAINAYDNSTGTNQILADNIDKAIADITKMKLPTQNDKLHDTDLFPEIKVAKLNALEAIEAVTNHQDVEGVKLDQIKLINDAIDAYDKSTGTNKILDDNKVTAIADINAITSPDQNDKWHAAALFPAIAKTKADALKAIKDASDYQTFDDVKLSQIKLIKDAINAYDNSTGTNQILVENIAKAISDIEKMKLPTQNDKLHAASLFTAIDQAKSVVIKAIKAVTDYKKVDGVKADKIDLINAAIDKYNNSKGTNQFLAEINAIISPVQDNKLHDVNLFLAIAKAKADALKAIEDVTDYQEIDGVKSDQIELIKNAINVYNNSTGTYQILANNKIIALAAINAIDLPIQEDKRHDAALFPIIGQAKSVALKTIEDVTDHLELEGVKSTQIKLINDAINVYKNSTGIDTILSDYITRAIATINAIKSPAQDDKLHDAALFHGIKDTKNKAIKLIIAIKEMDKVEGVKSDQIALINDAINAYDNSTGTNKILDDNKVTALAAINAIDLPAQENKLHAAALFPAIAKAKSNALKAIEDVTDYQKFDSVKSEQIKLINAAINAYNESRAIYDKSLIHKKQFINNAHKANNDNQNLFQKNMTLLLIIILGSPLLFTIVAAEIIIIKKHKNKFKKQK